MPKQSKINWYTCLDNFIDDLCANPTFEDDYGDPTLVRKQVGSNYPWLYVDFNKFKVDLNELNLIKKKFDEFVGEFGGSIEDVTIYPTFPGQASIEIRVKMIYVETSPNAKKALEG